MRFFIIKNIFIIILFPLLLCAALPVVVQAAPDWWAGVHSTIEGDELPAQLGQALYMAESAQKEMNARWGELGTVETGGMDTLIATFPTFTEGDRNALLRFGQLRYLAAPFYNRLVHPEVQQISALPNWLTEPSTPEEDQAIIHIGQLKYVFDFAIDRLGPDAARNGRSDGTGGADPNHSDTDWYGISDDALRALATYMILICTCAILVLIAKTIGGPRH